MEPVTGYELRDFGGWGWIAHLPKGGYYATNSEHAGLFLANRPPGDYCQLLGTGQFKPSTFTAFKRAIRRYRNPGVPK